MSIPTFWVYSECVSTAVSKLNNTFVSSESATAQGNNAIKTVNTASKLSLELAQRTAIQNLYNNGEILEYVDSSENTVISKLENIIYFVPNLKYVTFWQGAKVIDNANKYVFTGGINSNM